MPRWATRALADKGENCDDIAPIDNPWDWRCGDDDGIRLDVVGSYVPH